MVFLNYVIFLNIKTYLGGLIGLLNLNVMKKIWILIYVHRGFIQEPEIFFDRKSALLRKRGILLNFNKDYDEVEIFEKLLT